MCNGINPPPPVENKHVGIDHKVHVYNIPELYTIFQVPDLSTPVTLEPNLGKVRSSVEEMKKDLQRWEESGRFKTEERQWWETYQINQHDEGKR